MSAGSRSVEQVAGGEDAAPRGSTQPVGRWAAGCVVDIQIPATASSFGYPVGREHNGVAFDALGRSAADLELDGANAVGALDRADARGGPRANAVRDSCTEPERRERLRRIEIRRHHGDAHACVLQGRQRRVRDVLGSDHECASADIPASGDEPLQGSRCHHTGTAVPGNQPRRPRPLPTPRRENSRRLQFSRGRHATSPREPARRPSR